jgi:hypothetical protein
MSEVKNSHVWPFLLLVVAVVALLVIFGSPFQLIIKDPQKVSAAPQTQQERYHVKSVNFEGYDREGVLTLDTVEDGEGTFRRSKGGLFPPHIFEIDLDGGLTRYRTLGDKDNWKELHFDNASKAMVDFTNILRKYGEDVGACHNKTMNRCTVFLF